MKNKTFRSVAIFAVLLCLTIGVTMQAAQPVRHLSSPLTSSAAAQIVGGIDWGCGLLVGAVGGVIALGVAGATVGLGGALAISVAIHVGAIACAS